MDKAIHKESKRRRRELYIIVIALSVVLLLTYLEAHVFNLGPGLPIASSLVVFALVNINLLLLLFIAFLVTRSLVKLIFERRRRIFGSKLRTRLVVAFVTLSLVPTVLLFLIAIKFINTGIEFWFNTRIEQALKDSLEVGRDYYERLSSDTLRYGQEISDAISEGKLLRGAYRKDLQRFIGSRLDKYNLASIEIFSSDLSLVAEVQNPRMDGQKFANSISLIKENSALIEDVEVKSLPGADLIMGFVPIKGKGDSERVRGWVIVNSLAPKDLIKKMTGVAGGFEEYSQLKMLKNPIKIGHLITLSIVTLLIIFSATWFGFYLAKGITIPIQELAAGTHKIAEGDLDVHIDLEGRDEIGFLVHSFNRMAQDLRSSKEEIEATNKELRIINKEIEQRRKYMEIVLSNVAAGVIAIDARDRIRSINKSAERMLNIKTDKVLYEKYQEVLRPEHLEIADDLVETLRVTKKDTLQKEIHLSFGDKELALVVNVTLLRDERGDRLGMVVVFDDLTELEKAQRVAAWREVARRIAHEIKNPLTPIQLSAQRLRKRYMDKFAKDGQVFDECTRTIIKQVDEMMRLVNEFSNFARLPAVNPKPNDLTKIVDETLFLYREAHKDIDFRFVKSDNIPVFKVDGEQIKRVMINLLDNAVDSIDGEGTVSVVLSHDYVLKMVRIEVRDTGFGISTGDKARLFEPYFSTKKGGMGLGLAIVNAIVSDHHGFVRVHENKPRGTKFVVELPVET